MLFLIIKYNKYLLIYLFSYIYSSSYSQSSVLTAASPGWNLLSSEAKGEFDTLKLPLKRAGNLLLVEASVDGIRGNFILDTGAPGLLLNTTYFRQNAIRKNRSSVGIIGNTNAIYELQINRLEISKLYYEKIIVELTELNHIEDSKNIKILGLLGTALFENLELIIDVRKNTLYLIKPSKTKIEKSKADIISSFSSTNNAILIPMKINGKVINTCFDSGAEMMVLDPGLPNKIMQEVELSKRLNLSGTGGQKAEVWSGIVKSVHFGKLKINKADVLITSLDQLSEAYGQPIDAIIGFTLLNKGIMHINMPKKQMLMYLYKEDENE